MYIMFKLRKRYKNKKEFEVFFNIGHKTEFSLMSENDWSVIKSDNESRITTVYHIERPKTSKASNIFPAKFIYLRHALCAMPLL